MKSFINDLTVTSDDIEDIRESESVNPGNGRKYWLVAAVIFAIVCLVLLVPPLLNIM